MDPHDKIPELSKHGERHAAARALVNNPHRIALTNAMTSSDTALQEQIRIVEGRVQQARAIAAEVASMKARQAEDQRRIRELSKTAELEDLREKVRSYQASQQDFDAQKALWERDREALRERTAQFETLKSSHEADNAANVRLDNALEEQRQRYEHAISDLTSKLKAAEGENLAARNQISEMEDLKTNLTTVTLERDKLKLVEGELLTAAQDQDSEMEYLKTNLATMTLERDSAQMSAAISKMEFEKIEARVKDLEAKLTLTYGEHSRVMKASDAAFRDQVERAVTAETKCTELNDSLQKLRNDVRMAERSIGGYERETSKLKAETGYLRVEFCETLRFLFQKLSLPSQYFLVSRDDSTKVGDLAQHCRASFALYIKERQQRDSDEQADREQQKARNETLEREKGLLLSQHKRLTDIARRLQALVEDAPSQEFYDDVAKLSDRYKALKISYRGLEASEQAVSRELDAALERLSSRAAGRGR